MRGETREVWAKRIERLRDSGLTLKEFAAEAGVNAQTLAWWRYRLRADAKKARGRPLAPTRRPPTRPAEPATTPPVTFVELAPTPSTPLSVVLASGREIRVPVGFDAATFTRLLGILERSV